MERKEIYKLLVAIIVLAIFAITPSTVLCTATDTDLKLLAIGILLSVVLGGYNMIKSIFKNPVVEELKEANKLAKEQLDIEKAKKRREDPSRPF